MTTVLKLGGSVITDKHAAETVDIDSLDRAARIIRESTETDAQLVLVHGGGSFGHPVAARHGMSSDVGNNDAESVVAVHRAMGRLNERVVTCLHDASVPALPVRPLSLLARRGETDGALQCPTEPVTTMLGEGFVPVLHGDVVVHEREGATVLSGDDLVVSLAAALDAERVGVCSTVPGVLDATGEVIPEITDYKNVATALGESDATDVTGGMAKKVQALLALDGSAAIFGLDDLATFLETGRAGTTIK